MLQALLRGKLSRNHENIEDILTSNVFGLLRYRASFLALQFLSLARFTTGEAGLTVPKGASIRSWEFWPFWSEPGCRGCEPDLVLTIDRPGDKSLLLLVEAKLYSAKSSFADRAPGSPPNDQLAREWDNLMQKAGEKSEPLLIYLTSHFTLPRAEIEASIAEYQEKRNQTPAIAWLSWHSLHDLIDCSDEDPIMHDLRELLERMDLTDFSGIAPVAPAHIAWRFNDRDDWHPHWQINGLPNLWKFTWITTTSITSCARCGACVDLPKT